MPRTSIIVPVLDEAATVETSLRCLAPFRQAGAEVIVVDGGSRDGTVAIATPHADRVLRAPRGRGSQMNAGAAAAQGDILVFLHADTRLPGSADRIVRDALNAPGGRTRRVWGRFDVTIEGKSPLLGLVAALMNARSRATGIATGDQAMFATRAAFICAGGFPDIPLMEDIELSRRLKRISAPVCLAARVSTSGRRWESRGVVRTILLMWRLRLAHFFGTAPDRLARQYGYVPRQS